MTPASPHHEPDAPRRRRSLTIHRSSTALAVAMIAGVPFMAHALDNDRAEENASEPAAVIEPDQPSFPSSRSNAPNNRPTLSAPRHLDERVASYRSGVDRADERARSQIVSAVDPMSVETATADTAADDDGADRAAARDVEVEELLTAVYTWDERSLRVAALQEVLGVDIDGWYGRSTRRTHLRVLHFTGLGTHGVPVALASGPSADEWAALRQCESGGDYSIVSSSGRYRGAYQFARSTWDSVAEYHDPSLVGVDPAHASRADQDAMASALYDEQGAGPWPVCGRHLS